MRLPHLLSLSLLLLVSQAARAQFLTADDFFHSGAQFYISNNIPLAKERVKSGLEIYPADDKLKKLEQLLNQQQQQQSQNSQSQKDQQSQSQPSQSQDQQKDQKSKDPQPPQSDQQKKDEQAKKDKEKQAKEDQAKKDADQKKDQEKQAAEPKPDEGDKSDGETNEVADAKGAHAMTPKEAERLLNAQKGSEQFLSLKPKDKPENSNRPVKDW
jgi:outer membrane biosynthesis protein TonB